MGRHHDFGACRLIVSADDDTVPLTQRPCFGWLVERVPGAGTCSLGVDCDALYALADYAAYRALHLRLRALWLDDYEQR